jgi:hypothetical protein
MDDRIKQVIIPALAMMTARVLLPFCRLTLKAEQLPNSQYPKARGSFGGNTHFRTHNFPDISAA